MRHDFDPWSLLLGVVFVAVAVAGLNGWLVDLWDDPDVWTVEVVVPAILIVLGLMVGALASAMLRRRQRHHQGLEGVGEAAVDEVAMEEAAGDG